MAPRNTTDGLSGIAITYQSYQACVTFIPAGSVVIFVHVAPLRRHKNAVALMHPNTYATSGELATRSTASRVHGPAGAPGSATGENVLPPLVDTNTPSANAASSSTVPPFGWTVMSQHWPPRF